MSDHQSNNTNALGLSRRALLAGASGVGALALKSRRRRCTTTGRKSGDKFIFPLFYGTDDGSYFVIASKGGAPQLRDGH